MRSDAQEKAIKELAESYRHVAKSMARICGFGGRRMEQALDESDFLQIAREAVKATGFVAVDLKLIEAAIFEDARENARFKREPGCSRSRFASTSDEMSLAKEAIAEAVLSIVIDQ
jgi:hypothetical protein